MSSTVLVTGAGLSLADGVGDGDGEGLETLGSINVKSDGKSGTVEKSCAATVHGVINAKAKINAIRQNLMCFNTVTPLFP